MSVAQGMAADPRPEFKVAVFGLAVKFQRILEIVLRHARHNQYRYTVATSRGPGNYDIALVDMTVKGGPVVANTLRRISDSRPVITVGRRTDPGRRDDLLQSSFTMQVLKALNLVVDHQLLKLLPGAYSPQSPGQSVAAGERFAPSRFSPSGNRFANTGVQVSTQAAHRPRVLVIDDSPTVRRQLLEALVPMGLEVEVVSGGQEAINVLAKRRYDLIFVDVVMPDIDGYKLTRFIKKDKIMRKVPVIMLTSRSSPFDLLRGALAGCNSYLVKPVSLASLKETVQRHTGAMSPIDLAAQQLRLV
jgi:CheY-like chemotaxis protein